MDEDTTPTVDEPAVTQIEHDALQSASNGVDGTLTPNEGINNDEPGNTEEGESSGDEESSDNSPSSENDSEEQSISEKGETDESESQPAPELETEKDEAGVYSPPTQTDPGDFQPGDYSFEVRTTDGRSHKISTPEEIDAFASALDDNPELISASQFSVFNRKSALMEQSIASDRKEYETNKTRFDEEKALQETRDNTITQWNNEINYLTNSGDLPKISDEMNSADWSDPEIAKDPAVKARLEIFKWMESENTKRLGAGLEPIKSVIDAHNAMELDAIRESNRETVTKDKEARQKKGAMVGGASAYNPTNVPKNTIIGEGGSLDDLVTEFMNQ